VHEHEADGAGTDDDHGVAGTGSALFEAADDAGKRFGEGGVLEGDTVGDEEGVLFDDAGGDADVLGVGAVVEEEVFAEILLAMGAEETDVAGSGVEGYDAVAFAEGVDSGADFGDYAGELVTEGDRRLQHEGMVAAAVDLEISAAGKGCAYTNDQLSVRGAGDIYLL
jgi:hypothetical protein